MTSNEITICGKVYSVKPISSSVSMEEVATLVNVKMKELLEAKSKTSMVDVAVLTALNLGHELIELKEGKKSEDEQLNQHLDGMIQKLKNSLDIIEKKRVNSLTEDEVLKIREFIEQNYKVEGELRREVSLNIKRLVDLATYRGSRHKKKLPVRGQRTHCNARTRKDREIAIAGKK